MDLRELYQDIILDHGRHPRNRRALEHPTHLAKDNPLCGDKVDIFVILGEDGTVEDVRFEGRGCAISTASTSLMTEIIKGKTVEEAEQLFRSFHAKVTGGDAPDVAERLEDDLDRLEPLTGVKQFPVRVKCATLPWHAVEAALRSGAVGATVKTE